MMQISQCYLYLFIISSERKLQLVQTRFLDIKTENRNKCDKELNSILKHRNIDNICFRITSMKLLKIVFLLPY